MQFENSCKHISVLLLHKLFGLWFIGYTLQIPSISGLSAVNFTRENSTLTGVINNSSSSANFGTGNIFGDFITSLNIFWQVVSRMLLGGAMLNVLSNLGFNQAFILPLEVIILVLVAFAVIHLLSGRIVE